jgi:DNA-binding transcriptional ArsR family regulator
MAAFRILLNIIGRRISGARRTHPMLAVIAKAGARESRVECITFLLYKSRVMHDSLSASLSALADPTRRAILARLAIGEASVTELAKPFGMSQPAISRHLKVLETAGLIETRQSAQERLRRLKPGALEEVADWIARLRNMWGESFDRLDEFLKS